MAKLCAGQMTRIRAHQLGMEHVWPRILSVYGPFDGEASMVTSTIRKLLKGVKPSFTKGEQQWDYLYSGDAGKAFKLIGEKGKDGAVYPLGGGTARPLADYILMMRDAANPDAELGLGDIPYGDKQVMYLCADITDLTRDTGWVPETDFETGIANTVAWLRG
jgi:nucleoside-diphosphate-sugar epimerase